MTTANDLVTIQTGEVTLEGQVGIPDQATGLVIFAHGSGSSRYSSRNQAVAKTLRESHHLGTLLFDLLTPTEDQLDRRTRELRFDISLLSERVIDTIDWCGQQAELAELKLGCFGASTGAAAALVAAAHRPRAVHAVVSRGGRPDLVGDTLASVEAPTLLIVGQRDHQVLQLNQRAGQKLTCHHDIKTIANATHLFEEPGALEEVATLSGQWFEQYLQP